MKLSIIIPVYNVELYLYKCLQSITKQEYSSDNTIEIIIVNDGSTDNSLKIASEFATNDKRIKIISQANRGLSAARNKGLNSATGDYVWFIDSDDWIAEDSFKTIFTYASQFTPDVIAVRAANSINDELKIRGKEFKYANSKISGERFFNTEYWTTCVPFFIFRRACLINYDLSFMEGIFHEDNEFTPRMLLSVDTIVPINKVMYYVYQNPNSITRSINPKKSFDLIEVSNSLYNFSTNDSRFILKKTQKNLHRFISLCLNNALWGVQFMDQDIKNKFETALRNNKGLFVSLRKSKKSKYMIEWFLFKLSSRYYSIYSFLRHFKL